MVDIATRWCPGTARFFIGEGRLPAIASVGSDNSLRGGDWMGPAEAGRGGNPVGICRKPELCPCSGAVLGRPGSAGETGREPVIGFAPKWSILRASAMPSAALMPSMPTPWHSDGEYDKLCWAKGDMVVFFDVVTKV